MPGFFASLRMTSEGVQGSSSNLVKGRKVQNHYQQLTLRSTPRRRVLDPNQPPFRGTSLQERRHHRPCQEALIVAALRSARNLVLNSSSTLRMSARRASSSCFFSATFFPRAG